MSLYRVAGQSSSRNTGNETLRHGCGYVAVVAAVPVVDRMADFIQRDFPVMQIDLSVIRHAAASLPHAFVEAFGKDSLDLRVFQHEPAVRLGKHAQDP